jgi:hypothetical protein
MFWGFRPYESFLFFEKFGKKIINKKAGILEWVPTFLFVQNLTKMQK